MTRSQPGLAELLAAQEGVITRRQAGECGLTRDAIGYRIRPGGPWRRLLPGTFLTVTGQPTTEQLDMAALLYAGPGTILTGLAALRVMDLPGAAGAPARAPATREVLLPATRRRRSVGYVRIIRTTRMPGQVIRIGRRRYALPDRALADAVRGMTELREARALTAGAVQRGIVSVDLLRLELDRGQKAGSAVLRRVLAEMAEEGRSPMVTAPGARHRTSPR